MSASASNSDSKTQTQNTQTTTTGASGAQSPTITAGNNVSYTNNDPALQLATVQTLGDVINNALAGAGASNSQALNIAAANAAAQTQAAQQQEANQASILQQALTSQSQLAAYQGTGGGLQITQNVKYLIYAAVAMVGLLMFGMFFRSSSK